MVAQRPYEVSPMLVPWPHAGRGTTPGGRPLPKAHLEERPSAPGVAAFPSDRPRIPVVSSLRAHGPGVGWGGACLLSRGPTPFF